MMKSIKWYWCYTAIVLFIGSSDFMSYQYGKNSGRLELRTEVEAERKAEWGHGWGGINRLINCSEENTKDSPVDPNDLLESVAMAGWSFSGQFHCMDKIGSLAVMIRASKLPNAYFDKYGEPKEVIEDCETGYPTGIKADGTVEGCAYAPSEALEANLTTF